MTNLPALISSDARLPQSYEKARMAISECYRIDECKDWTDKAEALASYARQSRDETLLKTAMRIQGRAFRRVGELLGEIEKGKTGPKLSTAAGTQLSRKQAATDAGLSKRQKDQARRLANVSAERFEELIESDDPPTITELAELGTRKADHLRAMEMARRPGFKEAMNAFDGLRRFVKDTCSIDPRMVTIGTLSEERIEVKAFIEIARRWIEDLNIFIKES